jgi:glucokinase
MEKKHILRIINAHQMRSVNRTAVLELIRQNGPIARSEIARQLGLSQPTVMRIIDELIPKMLVRYTGETEGTRGRSRDLLEYYKEGWSVIGIDLGGTKMFGALANIGGEIQSEVTVNGHGTQNEASFHLLVNTIQQLIDSAINSGQQLAGIAVGAPGVTDAKTGIVRWAPSLNWRNYPVKEKLETRFNMPCSIDNDVNLAALGEHWFGAGQGSHSMVLIALGTGLGAGLILDGAIYRGFTQSAGEVGYMVSCRDDLNQSYDKFGALESRISGTGIAKRAQILVAKELLENSIGSITSHDVFEAAREQEKWAVEILNQTVEELSMAIVNISTILDPEVIILGGGVARSADLLIPAVKKRIEGMIPTIPEIKPSKLGRRAAVMGGIALTLLDNSETYVIRKLS